VVGWPHWLTLRVTEENEVGLVAISVRGESGLSLRLMGGVADRMLRGARVPVFVMAAGSEEAQWRSNQWIPPSSSFWQ
jgi:hypothetical protein